MDIALIQEKFKPLLKQNLLAVALGILGLIFFVYGLISLLGTASKRSDIVLEPAETTPAASEIAVDVEGAVQKPGLYSLKEGARIQDALIAANGISEKADRGWLEKNLNLAAKALDGSKIYIPRLGENTELQTSNLKPQTPSSSLININSASLSELDTLPGVGPATAQKIIDSRPYKTLEELLSKKAVNSKVFSEIKDKIQI